MDVVGVLYPGLFDVFHLQLYFRVLVIWCRDEFVEYRVGLSLFLNELFKVEVDETSWETDEDFALRVIELLSSLRLDVVFIILMV